MIVSDTTALHKKIEEMGQRIRQLEDALAIFQASVSTERHPLLRDELLKIKFPPETSSDNPDGIVKTENAHLELADALGTLTLGESGDARYLGRSAGPEVRDWPESFHVAFTILVTEPSHFRHAVS